MPDPILILKAMTAAALTAAAVLLLLARPWRMPGPVSAVVGSVLGVSLGFYAGCWLLGLRPNWPPREDQDRLLLILFPAVTIVELAAAFPGRIHWLVWPLRLIVAMCAARILLHNSSYLADLAGPGTREWTPAQTWMILAGLAAALPGVWAALLLAQRDAGRPTPSIPLALALACAGAAVTIMLSGYASGGQMGLPLAAALLGATAASLALPHPELRGMVSLGIVGLFALLIMGRFFGQLTTGNAALLFLGTLFCWIPEVPYVRRLKPRLRGFLKVFLVAVPVAVALTLAQQKFVEDSGSTPEPSIRDYMDYGK